jgi:hypothetical protein
MQSVVKIREGMAFGMSSKNRPFRLSEKVTPGHLININKCTVIGYALSIKEALG